MNPFSLILAKIVIWQHRSGPKFGSRKGLLLDSTKPLPESILTWDHCHLLQCYFVENMQDVLAIYVIYNQRFKYLRDSVFRASTWIMLVFIPVQRCSVHNHEKKVVLLTCGFLEIHGFGIFSIYLEVPLLTKKFRSRDFQKITSCMILHQASMWWATMN